MKPASRNTIVLIVVVYLLISGIWITLSDSLLINWAVNPEQLQRASTLKGWGFVVVTGLILGVGLGIVLYRRDQAQMALLESEMRFRAIYESAPVGYLLVDEAYIIRMINQKGCELLTGEPGICDGIDLTSFFCDTSQVKIKSYLQDVFTGRNPDAIDLTLCHPASPDRSILQLNAQSYLPQHLGDPLFLCVVQDITRRLLEEESRRRQQEDFLRIFDNVQSMIYYFDLSGKVIRANQKAAAWRKTTPAALIGTDQKDAFPADAEWFVQDNSSVLNTGIAHAGVVRRYTLPGAEDFWLQYDKFPFRDEKDQVIGLVVMVVEVTDHIRRELEMGSLLQLFSAVRRKLFPDDVASTIFTEIQKEFSPDRILILMLEKNTQKPIVRYATGSWKDLEGQLMDISGGISDFVMETGQPVLVEDVRNEQRLLYKDRFFDLRSAACVPLIYDTQALGVIWIGKKVSLSISEFNLLNALAEVAAGAMYRATLYQETQMRINRLSALRKIDEAITGSLNMEITLNVILDQIVNLFHVDAVGILLLDRSALELHGNANRGFHFANYPSRRLRLGENIAGISALERMAIRKKDWPGYHFAESDLPVGENFKDMLVIPLIAKKQVVGVLEVFHRSELIVDEDWMEFLQSLATQTAIAIDNASLFDRLTQSREELMISYDATIAGWARALELRDKETEGHSQRVVDLTLILAKALKFPEDNIPHLRRGVLLHDIGKMGIPDRILLKKGPLNPAESQIMRRHPVYAYQMLSPIPYLRLALDVPYCHHERWDGSGYPNGLKGVQIPLAARIFSVVDVWDALRSNRPYRYAMPQNKVIEFLKLRSGIDFDPEVVAAFCTLVSEGLVSHLYTKSPSQPSPIQHRNILRKKPYGGKKRNYRVLLSGNSWSDDSIRR